MLVIQVPFHFLRCSELNCLTDFDCTEMNCFIRSWRCGFRTCTLNYIAWDWKCRLQKQCIEVRWNILLEVENAVCEVNYWTAFLLVHMQFRKPYTRQYSTLWFLPRFTGKVNYLRYRYVILSKSGRKTVIWAASKAVWITAFPYHGE